MAKAKAEVTPAQKAADAAKSKLDAAKAANDKNDNVTTKKALEDAKAAHKTALGVVNRERFQSVGVDRTKKARAAIRRLINVANPKSYNYTPEEASKIIGGLKEAVKDVETAFTATGGKGAAGDSFSL